MNRMQSVIRISLLLLSALFIFSSSLINVSSVQAEDKQVKIGVLAKRGAKHCLQKWSPTAEYLSRNISNYSFSIVPLNFDQLIPATEKGEIDFVLSNSSYYVTLEITQRVDRLVTLINKDVNGKPMTTFAGVIFTLANRQDITSMKDLVGKRFIGADSRSLGGWLATLRELKQAGINPQKDFATLSFAGTHDATVYAVRDGQADVGCVRTSTLERMAEEDKINLADFKVIYGHPNYKSILSAHHLLHSTRAYPEWPLAKLKHVDDALAGQVAKTLIDMPSSSYAARRSHSFGWSV
ncbi:MAG: phosphate/phosphite/phosphonate ABC transporter substrate-binding protein, partial [Deltaproteobacteria bacterium]|nr:phosphate/phosphite/phosphonate ABC transporter substrate-binding protein [Candidatus Tharpella aukensis]